MMNNQSILDRTAWDYLNAPTLYRDELTSSLINAGAESIFPLLRAGLKRIYETSKTYFKPIREKAKKSRFGEQFAYAAYTSSVERVVTDIYAVANSIQQPAMDALCRALYDKSDDMRLLASLVLAADPSPNNRTGKLVDDAFRTIGSNEKNKEYVRKGGIIMVLLSVLGRIGSAAHVELIEKVIAEENISQERFDEKSRNTVIYYLLNKGAK
jgi:hypothetical protein